MNQEEEIKKRIGSLIRNATGFEQLAYLIRRSALFFEDIADGVPNEKLDNLENAVTSLNTLLLLAVEERVKMLWRFVDWDKVNEFAVFARGQKGGGKMSKELEFMPLVMGLRSSWVKAIDKAEREGGEL